MKRTSEKNRNQIHAKGSLAFEGDFRSAPSVETHDVWERMNQICNNNTTSGEAENNSNGRNISQRQKQLDNVIMSYN